MKRSIYFFTILTATMMSSTVIAQVAVSPSGQGGVRASNVRIEYADEIRSINQEDLKSKEISQEINMPKSGEIYIENNSRSIQVKIWDQQKVKVVTTAYFEKESTLTDEEWFERMGISLKALGSSVKIKSGASSFGSYAYSTSGQNIIAGYPTTVYKSGSINRSGNTTKKILTIYVPAGSKLDIETKYSEVQLPAGIGEVLLDITNGSFEAENLNKLRLRSKYSNANLRDIKEAEIEFANGRFTANNIEDLDIESKYSTIEMATAKKIKLVSTNDEFEVEDVTDIRGRKNYGNLRITRLAGSLEMDGSNADVKIRNVGPNVKLIKINNRYADIRIPLRDMKNYAVDFMGTYSTVYGDFERTAVEPTEEEKKEYANLAQSNMTATGTLSRLGSTGGVLSSTGTMGTLSASNIPAQPTKPNNVTGTISGGTFSGTLAPTTVQGYSTLSRGSSTPSKFTANIGNGSGLKVQMKCQNCTVDFK